MICHVFKPARWQNGWRAVNKNYSGRLRLDCWATPRVFSLQTRDRRIAEAKLLKIATDYEKEALGLLPARNIREALAVPLPGLLAEYLADLKARERAPGTIRKYGGTLRLLFVRLGWRTLRHVSSRSFVHWRVQSGLSARSVNDVLSNAQSFLRWLRHQNLLLENPLEFTQRIDTRGRNPCRRALSPAEFSSLLRVSPRFRSTVYATALYTGLRRKELNGLSWSDFELDCPAPYVRVPATISKNRRETTLPLHQDLAVMLRVLKPVGADVAAYPFYHRVPRIETFRLDLARAGIPVRDGTGRRVDFHSLRVTFGTTLLARGVHPVVVKELMRHSDLKLTTNLYTDPSQLPLARGVATLPAIALTPCSLNGGNDSTSIT